MYSTFSLLNIENTSDFFDSRLLLPKYSEGNTVFWFSLIGTRNVRTVMWITNDSPPSFSPTCDYCLFSSYNFSNGAFDTCLPNISWPKYVRKVCYVAPSVVLLFCGKFIHVFNPSDGEIITKLYFEMDSEIFLNAPIFYLSSKELLIFVLPNYIRCFKIHNLENFLAS